MMTRIAGGPGSVSPLDFNTRPRKPLNRNTWIAIGIVGLAHVGVGVVIYHQKFELRGVDQAAPETQPFDVIMAPLPKVIPLEPMQPARPTPPNAPVHQTPTPMIPIETFTAVPGPSNLPSNTITLAVPVPIPVPDAAPATPEPVRSPPVITRPRWANQPSAAQMERAYPRGALAEGVAGVATMNCLVSASGGLSDCAVPSETPRGQGFGRAANSLTRYFRLSPGTVDGQPIDGARVAFTVRFAVSD